MNNTQTIRRGLVGGLAAVALAAGAVVMTTPTPGQAQAAPEGEQVRVGTYEPEQVFGAYHGREAFMQQFQELQIEAQTAQQEGDQEQMMAIQQRLQEAQQEVIETFQNEVEQAMPDVAEKAGVQIVAVEVVYRAPNVETQNVTAEVIEKINEGHDVQQPEPIVPDMGVEQ